MILSSGDYVCNSSATAKIVIALTIPKVGRPDKKHGFYSIQKRLRKKKKNHIYGLHK